MVENFPVTVEEHTAYLNEDSLPHLRQADLNLLSSEEDDDDGDDDEEEEEVASPLLLEEAPGKKGGFRARQGYQVGDQLLRVWQLLGVVGNFSHVTLNLL